MARRYGGKEKPRKKERRENSNDRAIDERRLKLRGGLSVQEMCRKQFELDEKSKEWRKIMNRKSWCRDPQTHVPRMEYKKELEA